MKTLMFKLIPGAAVTLAAIALCSFFSARAENKPAPETPGQAHENFTADAQIRGEQARDVQAAVERGRNSPYVRAIKNRAESSGQRSEDRAYDPSPITYDPAAYSRSVIVCGVCGAQLAAPRAVLVAQPLGGAGYYRPEPRYVEPAAYAEPYYADAGPYTLAEACNLGEIRVNRIPLAELRGREVRREFIRR